MPRIARIAPKEYVYHVLTRGNNRQDVFLETEDYGAYLELLQRYKEKYGFRLYHYVLMTNHVHLVLEPMERGGGLAEIMKGINLTYAKHYKRKYGHMGHFWQDRYKSILTARDDYLLACGSYVELNPVRAKMVTDPKQYIWSSYNAYAYGRDDSLTDKNPVYSGLSVADRERERRYREFVRGMLREKKAMKGEMDGRTIYGDKAFIEQIEESYKVRASTNRVGRPRKG